MGKKINSTKNVDVESADFSSCLFNLMDDNQVEVFHNLSISKLKTSIFVFEDDDYYDLTYGFDLCNTVPKRRWYDTNLISNTCGSDKKLSYNLMCGDISDKLILMVIIFVINFINDSDTSFLMFTAIQIEEGD